MFYFGTRFVLVDKNMSKKAIKTSNKITTTFAKSEEAPSFYGETVAVGGFPDISALVEPEGQSAEPEGRARPYYLYILSIIIIYTKNIP